MMANGKNLKVGALNWEAISLDIIFEIQSNLYI